MENETSRLNYRVGGLFGVHFNRPYFSIVSKFHSILDTFWDTGKLSIWSIDNESLQCAFESLELEVDPLRVIIRSGFRISQFLKKDVTSSNGRTHLPTDLLDTFSKIQKKIQKDESIVEEAFDNGSRDNFLKDSAGIIDALLRIAGTVPPIKFAGYIEGYLLPSKKISWNVLERFDEGLNIKDSTRGEKLAINRYDFLNAEKVRERSLIFKVVRVPVDSREIGYISYAALDYQKWFPDGQSLEELGGPENLLSKLIEELENLIEREELLKLTRR